LRLNRIAPDEKFLRGALRAARTSYYESINRAALGICHGLAGDGEFLLECANVAGDAPYMDWVYSCADRLEGLMVSHAKIGIADWARTMRPDLLNGSAGVGWFLLQLSSPEFARDPVIN
jgi:hypothetical protein